MDLLSDRLVKRLKSLARHRPGVALRAAAALGDRFGPGSRWAPSAEEITDLLGEDDPSAIVAIQRRMAADILRSLTLGARVNRYGLASIADRISIVRPDRLLSLREQGEPVALVVAHVGGGRGTSAALEQMGVPARVGTLRPAPAVSGCVRFDRLGDRLQGMAFLRRAAAGLAQGEVPVISFDGALHGSIDATFLGRSIRVSRSLSFLAGRGARLLPATSRWVGLTGTIEATFHPPFEGPGAFPSQEAWLHSIVAWFEDYVRRNPGELRLWNFRELLAAEKVEARPATPATPSSIQPHDLDACADAALDEGRLDDAIRAYRRAIRLDPKSAWHYQGLGVAIARRGWVRAARSFCWRAVALDPVAARRWLEAHPLPVDPESPIADPAFVVGCPHGGTTILTRLLGSHPSMMNAEHGESNLFAGPPGAIGATLQRWDDACLQAGRRRWVEKSVFHTFLVPWLSAARPGARFIVAVRDGRDVVCSLKKRGDAYRDVGTLVDQWVQAAVAILPHREDPRFLWVRYEDLIEDPESTLERACRHLSEAFEPAMLDYWREPVAWNSIAPATVRVEPTDNASNDALRAWQINQPLFDGRGRWRAELTPEDADVIKRAAQPYLELFGYADDDRW